MLKVKTNIHSDSLNREDLYHEYLNKLREFKIDLVSEDDYRYDLYISTCIIIPFLDIKLIVQVHGVSPDGIKYYLVGMLRDGAFSSDHITLTHMTYDDNTIHNYTELYQVLDGNFKSFNTSNWVMDLDTIEEICNALLHRYLCTRGRWRKEYVDEGKSDGLDTTDYQLYIDF